MNGDVFTQQSSQIHVLTLKAWSRIKYNHASRGLTVVTSTSYLQTLSQDDALVFVASLQQVKAHLKSELEWMHTQLHQKTKQLEGIEVILSQAASIGILNHSSVENQVLASEKRGNVDSHSVVSETSQGINDAIPPIDIADSADDDRQDTLKPQRRVKTDAKQQKPKKVKQPKSSIKATRKGRKSSEGVDGAELGQFLQPAFQNKSLMESIAQVLDDSSEPLETDDIMAELYAGLSSQDYGRAKRSIANLLSLGKRKGKWQSIGRGRYTGVAAAIS